MRADRSAALAEQSLKDIRNPLQFLDKFLFAHSKKLSIRQLGKTSYQCRGVESSHIKVAVMLAESPDILIGVIAKTNPQVSGHFREHFVGFAADEFKIPGSIHAVEVDAACKVIVEPFKVAFSRNDRQIEHWVVISAEIEVAVIDKHITGCGFVNAKSIGIFCAVFFISGNELPVPALRILIAFKQPKTGFGSFSSLCIRFGRDNRHVQGAIVGHQFPDTAAVDSIPDVISRNIQKILLVADRFPFPTGRVAARNNAGACNAVLSACGIACHSHQKLSVKFGKPMDSACDRIIRHGALIDHFCRIVVLRVNFEQAGLWITGAYKIEFSIKFHSHPVPGHIIPRFRIAVGDRRLIGIFVDLDDGGLCNQRVVKITVIHQIHKGFCNRFCFFRAHGILERIVNIAVVNAVNRVIACPDVKIIPIFHHGPGIALGSVLIFSSQDTVHFPFAAVRVGQLLNGVPLRRIFHAAVYRIDRCSNQAEQQGTCQQSRNNCTR